MSNTLFILIKELRDEIEYLKTRIEVLENTITPEANLFQDLFNEWSNEKDDRCGNE